MQSAALHTMSVLLVLSPVALIFMLLQLASWRQRTRLAEIAQQIAVTDAVHAALGAIVSPVVRRTLGRGWRLTIAVPLDRPATVSQIIAAASSAFDDSDRAKPGRLQIVLTQQERSVSRRNNVLVAASAASGESVSWI
jgi:hypothetical protein